MAKSFFGRLRDGLERAVSSAVEAIREIVTGFSTSDDESPVIISTEKEADNAISQIEEEAEEARGKVFEDEQSYNDIPIELQNWYAVTDDIELAQMAWYSGIKMLDTQTVQKILNDNTKIRRTPHATVESAIQYMLDVPAGIRRGIVQKGNYYYAVLDDSTNGRKGKRKKSGKGKRSDR
jgi:hypothetical protein